MNPRPQDSARPVRKDEGGAVESSGAPVPKRLPAWWAALLCLPLYLASLDWGLPSSTGPAPDTVSPLHAMTLVREYLRGGGQILGKYPEGYILPAGLAATLASSVLLSPDEQARIEEARVALGETSWTQPGNKNQRSTSAVGSDARPFSVLVRAGRLVTCLFALLALLAVGRLADRLGGAGSGFWVALAVGTQPAFVHFAATMNTDMSAWSWWVLALCAVGRAVGLGGLLLAGVFYGLAAASKDAMLAFAPGMILLLCLEAKRGARLRSLGTAIAGGGVAWSLASGLLHFENFADHVRFLFSSGIDSYRKYPATPAGAVGLLGHSAWLAFVAAGAVGTALVVGGALFGVVRRRSVPWRYWLPALSYLFCFIVPIGFSYVRFTVPLMIAGSIVAAVPVAGLLTWMRDRPRAVTRVAGFAGVVLFLHQGLRVPLLKLHDPRVACARGLEEERRGDEPVWVGVYPFYAGLVPPPAEPRTTIPLNELLRGEWEGDAQPPRLVALSLAACWAKVGDKSSEVGDTLKLGRGAGVAKYRVIRTYPPRMDSPFVREVTIQPTLCILERVEGPAASDAEAAERR